MGPKAHQRRLARLCPAGPLLSPRTVVQLQAELCAGPWGPEMDGPTGLAYTVYIYTHTIYIYMGTMPAPRLPLCDDDDAILHANGVAAGRWHPSEASASLGTHRLCSTGGEEAKLTAGRAATMPCGPPATTEVLSRPARLPFFQSLGLFFLLLSSRPRRRCLYLRRI